MSLRASQRPGLQWAEHLVAGHVVPRRRAGRLKRWLNLLRRRYPEAQSAYDTARTMNDPMQVERWRFDVHDALRGDLRGALPDGAPGEAWRGDAVRVSCVS